MILSRARFFRPLVLSAALLGPASCGSSQDGPNIISFGTNVADLTDGESVHFSAVVTDPAGPEKILGGQLTTADSAIKYGAFVGGQPGNFALDLTWAQISQSKQFSFGAEERRTFVGEFYNAAGKKVAMPVELRFHCQGEPACEGRCVNTGNACPASTDKLCVAGTCQSGCYANKMFIAENAASAQNGCQVCQPAVSKTALQSLADYAPCATGLTCGAGKCEIPFASQNSKTTGSLFGVTAPTANLQMAVGALGRVVRTTDGGANWALANTGINDTLSAIFALNANEIYAVGASGTIIKSTDGGASWGKQTSGVNTYLNAVWASSANDIWAVGDGGVAVHSTNGGTMWTKLTTGMTTNLNSVWGSSATDVYIVGGSGLALRTINSGTTFTTLATGVSLFSFSGVWGSGAADVYLVGGDANVLRTTNSGTSFTKLTPPSRNFSMTSVWGTGANNVYMAGSGGQVWHVTDSATLASIPTGTNGLLYGISGSSANAFTVVGDITPRILRKL